MAYTRTDWALTKHHWKNTCAYCGKTAKKMTKEHVTPISMGGQKLLSNIVPACSQCNSAKSSYVLIEWFPQQVFYNEKRMMKIMKWVVGEYMFVSIKKGT